MADEKPVIRLNLASNILGDFNEDFLACFIHRGVEEIKDYSGMSTFTQRAYRTALILAAGVMKGEFANYYNVMSELIGREQCIGFMTEEKMDILLDCIVNSRYGQMQLENAVGYYQRWGKKNRLCPDDAKTLRMWMTRISKIRYDFKKKEWEYPPVWCQVRW